MWPVPRGAEHQGTDIQSRAGAIRRNPCRIGSDCLYDGIDEALLREGRHLHTKRGIDHTLCIQVGTEADNAAVLCRVCLKSFKNRLGIMQYTCILAHDDLVISDQRAIIPCAILIHGYISLVCNNIPKSQVTPIDVLFFHLNSSSRSNIPGHLSTWPEPVPKRTSHSFTC